jgi:hypothetical protein
MTRRIFEGVGKYTAFPNDAIDLVLPKTNPNVWKLICVIVRATIGYHKEEDWLSYSQLMEKTGIKSKQTMNTTIMSALNKGYILRKQFKNSYMYSLNKRYENRTDIGTKTVPKNGTKTVHTKESIKEKGKRNAQNSKPKRKADGRLNHPALKIYRGIAHFHVHHALRDSVIETVKDNELWECIIKGWIGAGWNPRNVNGMLDCYRKGGINFPDSRENQLKEMMR